MAIEASSLSLALQGFADHLADGFTEDVTVIAESPKAAAEQAKGSDKAVLNVFCYRILPSGIHPDLSANEPTFIRAQVLLTAFSDAADTGVKDKDLRVLGHAVRVLQSQPVIPVVLPGGTLSPEVTQYRLQTVLQATEMEELNHIWSIQGTELAYRLSVVYELALIPIEPLSYLPPPTTVESVILDVGAGQTEVRDGLGPSPLAITAKDGLGWLPFTMLKVGGTLSPELEVAAGTATVDVAFSGVIGEDVEVTVNWRRADETTSAQAPQTATIAATLLDAATATKAITLTGASSGDIATLVTRPKGVNMPAGNTLRVVIT